MCYDYGPMRILEKAQIMSAAEIDRTLQRLAHEIVERNGGTKDLVLIGIRRRGVPLAQRIAKGIRGIDGSEVAVGTLDITLYRDDLSKVAPQAVLQASDIPFAVDDMNLVLVDDVLYTGRTIRAAMNGLCWWTAGIGRCPSRPSLLGARCRPPTRRSLKCAWPRWTTRSASCLLTASRKI